MTLTAHLITVLLPGVVLDWLLGDPHWMPHPVRWMGRAITWLEGVLRRVFPGTPAGERLAGALLALLIPAAFGGGSWLLLEGLRGLSPCLAWPVEVWFTYQLLAARALQKESMAVCPPLAAGDLAGAREAVSRIVGRDTQRLDEAGVVKAAVETVAENTSDGVTAPLLFLALGGLPLGMVYKAVNTMDSMVGYRNERYRWFGTAAARLDDVLNWIPARLSGLMMCLAAALLPGCSGRRALRPHGGGLRRGPGSAAGGGRLVFWEKGVQAHHWGRPPAGGAGGCRPGLPSDVCHGAADPGGGAGLGDPAGGVIWKPF